MKPRTLSKIVFRSYQEMPDTCITSGDMGWNLTGSWRYLRPIYTDRTAPCTQGCPCGTDIEKWMGHVAKGEYREALEVIRLEHPFPSILGRVCFHPCEKHCNRAELEASVGIIGLERRIGDLTADAPPASPHDVPPSPRSFRVAIIGSGPSGLGAAYHLRRLGHEVDVFEPLPELGQMLRYGTPANRLSKSVLEGELRRIAQMGVRFHKGSSPRVSELLEQGFHRVFLAFGALRSRKLDVPGEEHPRVVPATEFLLATASGLHEELTDTVLVIGSGNAAVDSARAARRLGASVRILSRRTPEETTAFQEELDAALSEGVEIDYLVVPVRVEDVDGCPVLHCSRMKLGAPGPDGRSRPEPMPDSAFSISAGLILCAVGEEADVGLDLVPAEGIVDTVEPSEEMRTSHHAVLAGGDMANSPRSTIEGLAGGKRAAIVIDCDARGLHFGEVLSRIRIPDRHSLSMERYLHILREGLDAVEPTPEIARFEMMNTVYFEETPRLFRQDQARESRSSGFGETQAGITEEMAIAEALRCMHCGSCTACDNCFVFCPDAVITPMADGTYLIDYDYCKGCALCVHECPRAAMRMVPERAEV